MLIKAKNRSGRSKSLEGYLRLENICWNFLIFIALKSKVIRRSESENISSPEGITI
ncbi:TraY domain-containing protein [Klebsiella pneumoniae]